MTWATVTIRCPSLEACQSLAVSLAGLVQPPLVVELNGTLGAGKTQWTKFWGQALGATAEEITSPTFVIMHRYATDPVIYHLDAYRVRDEDEFLELGVEELFEQPAIVIIEWGEKFADLLPKDRLVIDIEVVDATTRDIRLKGTGERSSSSLARWRR
jgi:tRNA threonylcarbamoyladenosine biosynthesis protein TsaE